MVKKKQRRSIIELFESGVFERFRYDCHCVWAKEFLESSEKGAPKINSAAIAVADNFDNEAAAYKLDEEMRSAVYGSLGSSAGALVSAFVLSGFYPR